MDYTMQFDNATVTLIVKPLSEKRYLYNARVCVNPNGVTTIVCKEAIITTHISNVIIEGPLSVE